MKSSLPSSKFWSGKNVLITGHTGFKGSWLTIWLSKLGANVTGIGLNPDTEPSLFTKANVDSLCDSKIVDIRKFKQLRDEVLNVDPQIVIHLAAQPLVRHSYEDPRGTFEVNIMGTTNLLESLSSCASLKSAVIITTDKVYKNNEDGKHYSEDSPLGGFDPYSASKAGTEMVINSYRKSFFEDKNISISSARAGNVIGGGDWAKDRLIPDAIKSWISNETLEIRSPNAVRPWQHVLEPLSGYLALAEATFQDMQLASDYNFGPHKKDITSVKTVIDSTKESLKGLEVNFIQNFSGPHEANLLFLDISKAMNLLKFKPKWNIQESISYTLDWYKGFYNHRDALDLCMRDIEAFEN